MRQLFEEYIDSKLSRICFGYVDLVSGDIHKAVGGFPSSNHRMPTCCAIMYKKMCGDDKVLEAPPSGKGSRVRIRYYKRNHK